jgi:FkbM family methyltransferase
MALLRYREIMDLEVQGQRFELLTPIDSDEAQGFKRRHLQDPRYEYEAVATNLVAKVLTVIQRPQMLDIGAFIGYHSLLAGKFVGERGHVWGIESNRDYLDTFDEAVRLNGVRNVTPVYAALSDRSEPVRSLHRGVFTNTAGNGVVLESETCDALCGRLNIRPNVVKMDVDGFEAKVIGGMRKVMSTSLECMLLELHPNRYLDKYTEDIGAMTILDEIEAAGLQSYYVAGHRSPSPVMLRDLETGQFAYEKITPRNRETLLFDRPYHLLVVAVKRPLEEFVGASTLTIGEPAQAH